MSTVAKNPASSWPARRTVRGSSTPYLLIAPAALLIAVFVALPVGVVAAFSLFQYNVAKPWSNHFTGVGNFVIMSADPAFWRSLLVTAAWVGVEVVLQLTLGLGLALLLNRAFRGRALTRALSFAPWAVSGVLTTQIWLLIYSPTTGIAQVLSQLGHQSDLAPLASATGAFWSAAVAELWRGLPFFAIMLLADMQAIPLELYEAADVDGAGKLEQFRFVTLPHLREAILITTLLRAVWEFNNVDLLFTLTNGGPAGATTTLPLLIVNQAVNNQNFGYGSALTVVGFVILLVGSIVYLRIGQGSKGAEA